MSSPQVSDSGVSTTDPCGIVSRLLGTDCEKASALYGGRNNRVDRVYLRDGTTVILKRHLYVGNGRDRGRAEYEALAFMTRIGVSCVPGLLASEPNVLVMEDISGVSAAQTPLSEADVDAHVAFLMEIDRHRAVADGFPHASEAAFTIESALDIVRQRRRHLDQRQGPGALTAFLDQFLTQDFDRVLARLGDVLCSKSGTGMTDVLPARLRILSPSDLGPHNAIRATEGRLVFVDFEHFGWDDPAKTACDFLLHPGFQAAPELRAHFASRLASVLPEPAELQGRITALYPVFAMKWCVILLNEFLPGELARRRFSADHAAQVASVPHLESQLAGARDMLRKAEVGIDFISTT